MNWCLSIELLTTLGTTCGVHICTYYREVKAYEPLLNYFKERQAKHNKGAEFLE